MATFRIIEGDALAGLKSLRERSAQVSVTSPPYYGLRAYGTSPQVWGGDASCAHDFLERAHVDKRGVAGSNLAGRIPYTGGEARLNYSEGFCRRCGAWRGELGLEPTPELYVEHLVEVFREVKRVLRDDATLWLNIGDSFNNRAKVRTSSHQPALNDFTDDVWRERSKRGGVRMSLSQDGLKEKDLIGIPWMLAFALRVDGWFLRSEIIWAKGVSFDDDYNGTTMPESVKDRPTKSHEQIFLLSKQPQYFYDYEAVRERAAETSGWAKQRKRGDNTWKYNATPERIAATGDTTKTATFGHAGLRNLRSVWTVNPKPYREAHFATFPIELITPCVLAGSKEGDTVLDPFTGSGTTGLVALRHNRNFVGCELNPSYVQMARNRILDDSPMFNREESAA